MVFPVRQRLTETERSIKILVMPIKSGIAHQSTRMMDDKRE